MALRTLEYLAKFGRQFGHMSLREAGMGYTECLIGSYVFFHPDCGQDEAVQAMKLDKTTAAKAAQLLEGKGMLMRTQDEADKRKKHLRLTGAGEERFRQIVGIHNRWMEDVLSVLSPEEQAAFDGYCVRILEAAEKWEYENRKGTIPCITKTPKAL